MIRFGYLVSPARSVIGLCRQANLAVRKRLTQRRFKSLARGRRERCWCGGSLMSFQWHGHYGVCRDCGCYVNRRPPVGRSLEKLYSYKLYWKQRQQLKGYPKLEQRVAHDRRDGRLAHWLGLIDRYGPQEGMAVEVGCAHGVLLWELKARGYQCVGVEPDPRTAAWTRRHMGLEVRPGFFPAVEVPQCELFLSFDVLEHSPDPVGFVKAIGQVLRPGGVGIIQTPIERYGYQPPFGEKYECVFDDLEHLYIFTRQSLQRLIETTSLSVLAEDAWRVSHEIVVVGH